MAGIVSEFLLALSHEGRAPQPFLFDPAVTVQELLGYARRSPMQFGGAFYEPEAPAKLIVQGIGVIAHDVQPAALGRALWPKRADNDVAAGLYCASGVADISDAVLGRGQKMKNSAVVPNIISERL